jgi:C-terminal peptidase prc
MVQLKIIALIIARRNGMRFTKWFVLIVAVLILAACEGQTDSPEAGPGPEATNTIEVASEPTATDPPAAATATATVEPQDTPVAGEATEEPAPEETATLPPIRATQQALADAVQLPTRSATVPPIAPDDYEALVDQGCNIVRENYVRDDFNGVDWNATCEEYRALAADVDSQEAFWDLMADFIAELGDEHSRFVEPGNFAGEFGLPQEGSGQPWPGLTLTDEGEGERLLIWDVCSNGPAARAGLQRGDAVLAIDGEPVPAEFGRRDIYETLYAGGKDEVVLTVQQGPDAEPQDVSLQYGGASGCAGWQYGMLSESPRIGYVRVPSFGGNSDTNLLWAIETLEEEQPLDGLVVDVRHNPGGNSDRDIAIFTTGDFGMTGPLREDATQTIYRIRGPVRWNETTPVAVLTDGNSASASEYFATAMQQSGRATIVGMPTAGNTEGITGFNLADGSLIRLAVMTLQLPDGSTLEGTGVQPDIRVPLGEWGLRQQPDVQLQAAYDHLAQQVQ